VRQAIAIAINKQEIVKAFWGEMGKSDPHYPPSLESFSQILWLTISTIHSRQSSFN